jgi:hypothetical protein
MEELHNWLFHYNPFTQSWSAFKREQMNDYFNGKLISKDLLRSKSQKTLEELIVSHEGDIKKINEFVALNK